MPSSVIVTVTVPPISSEVPVMVGVVSVVVTVGPPVMVSVGAVASTVMVCVVVVEFPESSSTTAVTVWGPSVGSAIVTLQSPLSSTMAVKV